MANITYSTPGTYTLTAPAATLTIDRMDGAGGGGGGYSVQVDTNGFNGVAGNRVVATISNLVAGVTQLTIVVSNVGTGGFNDGLTTAPGGSGNPAGGDGMPAGTVYGGGGGAGGRTTISIVITAVLTVICAAQGGDGGDNGDADSVYGAHSGSDVITYPGFTSGGSSSTGGGGGGGAGGTVAGDGLAGTGAGYVSITYTAASTVQPPPIPFAWF